MSNNRSNSSGEDLGNTGTRPPLQASPCIKYCWTYNNYNPENLNNLEIVLKDLGKYCFGLEIGDSGTPHLQGWIKLSKKMRITELKKYPLLSNIHWEKQKGNDHQAISYCLKSNLYKNNFDISKYLPEEELDIIEKLMPWQEDIINIISKPADKRSVYWFWEPDGGAGKSVFSKYLCHKHNAIYIDEGKKSDIINIIYNTPKIGKNSIIVIDIPRNNGNNVSYKAIEQIKNGLICNTKYETGSRIFNSPHVIIFSNNYPDKKMLSNDRWKIARIFNNTLEWDLDA